MSSMIYFKRDTRGICGGVAYLQHTANGNQQLGCVICARETFFSSHRICEIYLPDAHHHADRKVLSVNMSLESGVRLTILLL